MRLNDIAVQKMLMNNGAKMFEPILEDVCPKCGSEHLTRIERMNGYLSYSKVRGRTMYADHKLAEFKERKSM